MGVGIVRKRRDGSAGRGLSLLGAIRAAVSGRQRHIDGAGLVRVVGEQAVDNMLKGNGGEGLGPQTSYTDINGQRRVSDGTTANGSIEMKNFKIQGCSKQIEAAVEEQWQT